MTPAARLLTALRTLRWSMGTLAVALGRSPSTVRSWSLGRGPVPPDVLEWVEGLAECHALNPAPEKKYASADDFS